MKNQTDRLDQWYDLIGTKNSAIHIRMNWFYLSNNILHFEQIQRFNDEHVEQMLAKISPTLATSVLIIYIERAEQLPSTQHGKTLEPYPFCVIKIDNYEEKTSIMKHSTNPSWMKSWMFMLVNPEQSLLHIDVNDSSNKNHLIGTIEIPIKTLMESKDWMINQSYPLKSSFANTRDTKLFVKLQLQILTKHHPMNSSAIDLNQSLVESKEKKLTSKKSKIHFHLINKNLDQQIVQPRKSSQMKKSHRFQTMFSSCVQKMTTMTSNKSNQT